MRRRSASPDAETRSYWPPPPLAISDTISLEDPAYFALTWQPVAASNGLTHCGWAYPSHAIRLSFPSVLPTEVGTGALASGAFSPEVPLDPPVDELPPLDPQAASATATTANSAAYAPVFIHILIDAPLLQSSLD